MSRLRFYFDRLLRRERLDRDMNDEMQFHIGQRAQDLQGSGVNAEEAIRRARVEFGGVEHYKEASRDVRRLNWLHDLAGDLRYGWRSLRNSPGFTAAAVLTLALGIGANTAIFSMVSWLVLRPLPVAQPDQLVFLAFPQGAESFDSQFSLEEYRQIRQSSRQVFSDVGIFSFGGSMGGMRGTDGMTADGTTQPVQTVFVSGNFFSILGVQPHLGRLLLPAEGSAPGADPVVVLSYQYWHSRFGLDPSIIGKQVAINGRVVTVVGVAPRDFYGVTPIIDMQAYLPLGMAELEGPQAAEWFRDPKLRPLILCARLCNRVSSAQAQAALAGLGRQLANENGRHQAPSTLLVEPLRPPGILSGHNPLPQLAALFLTLASFLLMLASINVANLLLVRAGVRQHEMSIRSALGAARGRLVRQMLTESVLLALLGCAAGILVGLGCNRLLANIPLETEYPLVLDVRFDWRVFVYTVAASVLTGILVGLVPAFRAARVSLAQTLQEHGRSVTGARQRWRSMLTAAQIGGSLALLIAAALFARSLQAVRTQNFGFDPHGVLNLKVSPHQIGMTDSQGREFYRKLLDRTRSLPGVESASLASSVPLGDDSSEVPVEVPGYDVPKGQRPSTPAYSVVSTGYLATMQMRLQKGRDFTDSDTADSAKVAIINQQMADRFWPQQDPIGRQFTTLGSPNRILQIVGVVNNSRLMDPDGPMTLGIFVPMAQNYLPAANLQVRTSQAPEAVVPAIREVIHEIEPTMPVYGVRTMEQAVNGINGVELYSLGAGLAAGMGAVGLLLAIVGVYGVISYSVNQRRQEIGIRVALGARPVEILYLVSRQGLLMVCAGVGCGLAAAFALSRLLSGFLTGVSDTDPLTYFAVSVCLALVAILAGYIPARRATRVEPMVALRCE